ncbi:hypothetical protein B0H12DRAFT_1068002 [Mycena haematopus]|nr:hypothetical protein B0H12DRAFT_1068002 [Mycena haematopus]
MLVRWFRLPVYARRQRLLHNWKPPTHLTAWQEDAVQACMNALQAGRSKIGVQLAQGQGVTLAALIDRMLQNLDAKQILVVAESGHKDIADKILQYHPHWTADIYTRTVTTLSNADVFLTSYNNMVKDERKANKNRTDAEKGVKMSQSKRMRELFVPKYEKSAIKVVILSDVDRFERISFDALLQLLRPPCPPNADQLPPLPVIIGTSSSNDFNALRRLEFIEEVVYQRMYLDHIQETWECDALFYAVPAQLGLRKVPLKWQTSFSVGGLSKVMCQPLVIKQVIQEWQERAATRKSTLVYCVGDIHSKKLAGAFKAAGIDARDLPEANAKPDSQGRALYDEQMAAFQAGQFPVLLVSQPDSKAVHVPGIDCVLLAAPVIERQVLANMIWSGMKSSPETSKENCLVIDILDGNFKRCPAYNLSTLFQLEPLDIDEQPPDVLRELAKKKALIEFQNITPKPKVVPPRQPTVQLLPIGEDEALLKQGNREDADVTLKTVNKFFKKRIWVLCAPGVYVYDGFGRGHALLRQVNIEGKTLYEAYWTSRRLLEGTHRGEDGKAEALKLSVPGDLEDILLQLSPFLDERIRPPSNYRRMKANETQLAKLKELCPKETMSHVLFEGAPMARDAFLEWLTVGHASDAIARLRYRTEPDLPPFSHAEQARIVNNIRHNKIQQPGEINKKALREMLQVRKREERAREAGRGGKTEDGSEEGEVGSEDGEVALVVTESGEIAPAETDREEDGDAERNEEAAPLSIGNDGDAEVDKREGSHAQMEGHRKRSEREYSST